MASRHTRGSGDQNKATGNGHHKRSASVPSGEALRITHDLNNVLLLAQFSSEERLVRKDLPKTSLSEVVRDALPLLHNAIRTSIHLDVTSQAPGARIRAKPDEIKQLLLNLVLNASDAMPRGGSIHIRTAQDTPAEKGAPSTHHRNVLIEVRDTGPGIPESLREKVFQPFFTSKPGAKGLGLTAVRRIAERLSGQALLVETEKGTCIQVWFPNAMA